jgi:hypothetical protein
MVMTDRNLNEPGKRRQNRILVLAAVLAAASPLRAQTYHGGIRGEVRDADGVIPGATVRVRSQSTETTRATVSNDAGQYAFPSLQPGTYTVSVEVPGFKPYERPGIDVGVQSFFVVDVLLEVGGISESIVVNAASPVLETADASRASSLGSVELETLPTASRNPFYLSVTTPNVVPSGVPEFNRMQDQNATANFSIGGGPRGANNYTIDGISITDIRNRAVIIPSIESVEEVKIQVSTYDAEMGRTGGGVFNTLHKSGGNAWHGTALVQNRPPWATGQLYFAKQANEPKPDGYYWLYGGSGGGPIIPNKTFFWASTEGYRTSVARNTVLVLPTAAEARGDFSQSNRILYDPLTTRPDPNNPGGYLRDPFPGNVIPADRLNPVGLNLAAFLAERGSGELSASASVVDAANQFSFNLQHQFNERNSLSATYMYYDSGEPFPLFYGGPSDPNNGVLFRQVNFLAVNDTWVASDDTVVAFRYGYFAFQDEFRTPAYDPGGLGFSSNYLGQIEAQVFPEIDIADYDLMGSWASDDVLYSSQEVNVTVSKLVGNHTFKFGGGYRRIGNDVFAPGPAAGSFAFNPGFTAGPDPTNPDLDTGDSLASLLLGFPAAGDLPRTTAFEYFLDYFGGFVQDDWRVSESIVLNLGLRLEHETGLREKNDTQVVGFDRESPWPVQPVEGVTLRGGLMYAGVGGNPTEEGDPTALKWGPRAGLSWSLDESTVLRGGFGLFWVPYQPTSPSARSRGYNAVTPYLASTDGGLTPAGTLTDPFPRGVEEPMGSTEALLTGAGTNLEFPDQFRKSPYVQQYSVELSKELSGSLVLSAGYLGSRSERLAVGGGQSALAVNINQVDPSFLELGSGLLAAVPNPFYGDPTFGPLSQSPTTTRSQLLRPYPQFQALWASQMSAGRRRYDALTLEADRRFRSGWGARVNYTWSRTDDSVSGEANAFSNRNASIQNSYDLDSEYSRSITDTPHRLNVSGIVELPLGLTFSATGYFQSGFPIAVFQGLNNTGLLGDLQRPNVAEGVAPGHEGSTEENLGSYLNRAAWTQAPAFTFGSSPRTDPRVRTPARHNWDVALQKSLSVGAGSLLLRVEVINLFDHADFSGPVINFSSPNFGKILSVGGFPRLAQFTVRYQW